MSFYDEVQMQVTKTVQNVPLLHGHWHEVMKAIGQSHCRWRFAPACPTRQSHTTSDRQRLAPSPNKRGPASYPTPCSQQGWGQGCWEVADWQQWKIEPLAVSNATVSRVLSASGCTVLLKNEEVARNCTGIGQHLLFQQHVLIIRSICFDASVC